MPNNPMNISKISTFTRHYLIAALWATNDGADDAGGDPLDANYSLHDIAPEALAKSEADCEAFKIKAGPLLDAYGEFIDTSEWSADERAGHDFFLTRCGHGAGFWDRSYAKGAPDSLGDDLSAIACEFGNVDFYVGDNGKIYC